MLERTRSVCLFVYVCLFLGFLSDYIHEVKKLLKKILFNIETFLIVFVRLLDGGRSRVPMEAAAIRYKIQYKTIQLYCQVSVQLH